MRGRLRLCLAGRWSLPGRRGRAGADGGAHGTGSVDDTPGSLPGPDRIDPSAANIRPQAPREEIHRRNGKRGSRENRGRWRRPHHAPVCLSSAHAGGVHQHAFTGGVGPPFPRKALGQDIRSIEYYTVLLGSQLPSLPPAHVWGRNNPMTSRQRGWPINNESTDVSPWP